MRGYKIIEEEPHIISSRERVMASTVSVDEYFDELIEQVHHDYFEERMIDYYKDVYQRYF